MEQIMVQYLSASVSASILFIFLYLGRRIWKRKLSKTWQYYIWLLLVMRLLIPISPMPGVLGNTIQNQEIVLHHINGEPLSTIESEIPYTESADENTIPAPTAANSHFSFFNWLLTYGFLIWLVPAAVFFLRRLNRYCSCIRSLKAISRPTDDPHIMEACNRAKEKLGIKKEFTIYHCRSIFSPMLAGLTAPCILLPENSYSGERLYYIFCHELMHYRRKDILYKWLIELSVCIHWFNPVVYLLRRECSYACELSCDETVITGLSTAERAAYGDTLLSSITFLRQQHNTISRAPASMLFHENTTIMKERLESLMNTKKTTFLQKTASLVLTMLLLCSLLLLGTASAKAETANTTDHANNDTVTDPWLNDSGNPESKKWRHSFMTTSFFANGYGIKLAWNNDASLYKTTRQISAEKTYTVSFTEETAKYADDPQVLESIRLSVLEQKEKETSYAGSDNMYASLPMEQPVLVAVDGPYNGTYDELADRFYREEFLGYYSSVLKKASKEIQKSLAERAYGDDRIAEFSISSGYLSKEENAAYFLRSYEDNKIPYFSILTEYADKETHRSIVNQSYAENKISFFAVAFDTLTKEEQKQYAYRSYEDNKINFFSIAVDSLDSYESEALLARALKENKKIFCYVIPGYN